MPSLDTEIISGYFGAGDNAQTSAEKGDALEELIVYLFGEISGLEHPQRTERNPEGSQEIDVAFWNQGNADGLIQFSPFILIECKNWSSPIGYPEIALFADKLRSRGNPFGVLVAAQGITGAHDDRQAAHGRLYALLGEGIEIIVLTRHEIELLGEVAELVVLLIKKRLKLRLNGAIYLDPRTEA